MTGRISSLALAAALVAGCGGAAKAPKDQALDTVKSFIQSNAKLANLDI